MATNYRGLFGGGTTRRRRGVRIEDVRGTYSPIFGSGVAAAARAARGLQQARDTSIARAAQAAGRSASSAGSGSGGAGRPSTRIDASGAARSANQAAQAIRRQVARGGGQNRSAPASSPRSGPAHRTLPNPVPGSTGTGLTRPIHRPGGTPQADTSRTPRPPSAPPPRTAASRSNRLVKRAQAAKIDPGSFDKDTLNRAVSRFMATHKWARQAGAQSEAVRKAAAYLLSKEHGYYSAPAGKAPKRRRRED